MKIIMRLQIECYNSKEKEMQLILQGNTDEDITTMEDICDIMETKLSPEEL